MPPDFSFIADAAQTDADIFASQCLGNALSHRCLAGAWCSNQEQNRSGLIFLQRHNRNLLQDSFLNLVQAVVIPVQNFTCLRKIHLRSFIDLPFQGSHEIQIIFQGRALRIIRLSFTVMFQYLVDFLARLRRHPGFIDQFLIIPCLSVLHVLCLPLTFQTVSEGFKCFLQQSYSFFQGIGQEQRVFLSRILNKIRAEYDSVLIHRTYLLYV